MNNIQHSPFGNNATLDALLDMRDHVYSTLSAELISIFQAKLTEAVKVLWSTIGMAVWSSAERVPGLDGFLRVVGISAPMVGTTIKHGTSGNILITTDNQSEFFRFIRLLLPVNLLQDGSVEDISTFIKELSDISEAADDATALKILTEYVATNMSRLSEHHLYTSLKQSSSVEQGVSMDEPVISREQAIAMRLFSSCVSKSKN